MSILQTLSFWIFAIYVGLMSGSLVMKKMGTLKYDINNLLDLLILPLKYITGSVEVIVDNKENMCYLDEVLHERYISVIDVCISLGDKSWKIKLDDYTNEEYNDSFLLYLDTPHGEVSWLIPISYFDYADVYERRSRVLDTNHYIELSKESNISKIRKVLSNQE